MDRPQALPLPPDALMERTGALGPEPGRAERYLARGAAHYGTVHALLPDDLDLAGGRVLDFGCGAGRVLRHFAADERWGADRPELHGVDVDRPSVDWLNDHLAGVLTARLSQEAPGLPYPDAHFDLVVAASVFTHLSDHWAGWLLECHRVLKPGGVLVATTLGAPLVERLLGEPWRADRIGIRLTGAGRPWDEGGPFVFCSPWWVREHWGRLFEVLAADLQDARADPDGDPASQHDVWALRPRPVQLDVAALEAWDPDEPREAVALRHSFDGLWRELGEVRGQLLADRTRHEQADAHRAAVAERLLAENAHWRSVGEHWESVARHHEAALGHRVAEIAHWRAERDHWHAHAAAQERELDAARAAAEAARADAADRATAAAVTAEALAGLQSRYDVVTRSSSWRLTAPLRRAAALARRSG